MPDLDHVFGLDGALAQGIAGFRPRQQQLEMAQAVEHAIESQGILVAEAGTGTGKTYAYLVPALLSGGKVIISTGTKTLQDQLFQRDIPTVRAALKVPVTVALLKGRANYVCHYHLEKAALEGRFSSREEVKHLQLIRSYAHTSSNGDKSGCAGVPENAPIWPHVTSTKENCLGTDCPHHKECYVMQARKEAMAADVVVVNHHLFFADVWLRDEGAGELLPACNTVVFDEAHQLPEVASLFFGDNVSSGQLLELARDSRAEALTEAKDMPALNEACGKLEKAVKDLRLAFEQDNLRLPKHQLAGNEKFQLALDGLAARLIDLLNLLEATAERGEGLKNCHERALALNDKLHAWQLDDEPPAAGNDDETGKEKRREKESVRWVEVFSHAFQLNSTPLDIADVFRKQINIQKRAWVFTSATLAVNREFKHYCYEMGLYDAETACWDSPFDYKSQALLYVPKNMPEPNSREFTAAVVDEAWPALKASQGRAFLLFTSLRAMREAYELVKARLESEVLDYPLLLQGEGSRTELLERFRSLPHAVLVASQTFWEGIDVKGEALQLVVIDKLPFAPPDDPVLSARVDQINRAGRNAFIEYQLPRAAITLKQGAGRLIRDERDAGVLMICDTRIVDKPYGKRIWQSLPPMLKTRDAQVIPRFFAQLATRRAAQAEAETPAAG
ncbi:ATP-dependent DNA helicase [Chitinivorax sp. PXF-14]|uniref:ATP-dependent DNA helicase n=1 Tax=Chitinivorax sp. PXF-14 TaxID=3230488 RepID=UPI003465D3DC